MRTLHKNSSAHASTPTLGDGPLVSRTWPLITVIKHRQHPPEAPVIMGCSGPGTRNSTQRCTPVDNRSLENIRVRGAVRASVKDTNESNETEGKTAPEIYTTVKHLREAESGGGASEGKPQKERERERQRR